MKTIQEQIEEARQNNYDFVDYRTEEPTIKTANELETEMLFVILQKEVFDRSNWNMIEYDDAGLTERTRIAKDFSFAFTDFLFEGI